jgi:DNA invertase Pin-like site-specific DNA recombinase
VSRRAVIYARISHDRVGAGLGVQRQLDDSRQLADQLGWTVVAEHADNDLSAYSGKPRPGYRALLEDLRTGRADAVLAWHTDRLHRSPRELEEYIVAAESQGAPTHFVKAGALDLATPSGRLVARQLGAVARYEVEHLIERQKAAKLQAARGGRFRGGRRAFGYEADGCTVREKEARIIREVAGKVLANRSVRSIALELNDSGCRGTLGGAWTGASVRDVLLRARNAGLIEHQGQIVGSAQWEPLLDQDTWRQVVAKLRDPARVRVHTRGRRWLGSGLYACGRCGAPVRIASAGKNKPHARPYYRCSGPQVHVSRVAEHVDALVGSVVVERLREPDAAVVLRQHSPGMDPSKPQGDADAVRKRLDELAEVFAAGEITARQLAQGSESLRTRLDELERKIADAYRGSALEDFADGADPGEVWDGLPLEKRRDVVDLLMTVRILPGKAGRKAHGIYFDPHSVEIKWKSEA